ncbi:MAG: GAF domain-containing SpoIIE family protein phosphatase [Planctomycetota bacterium]
MVEAISSDNAYRRVLAITRKLLTPIDLDPLLSEIVDIACELHDADRASVFLYDAESNELYARVAKGAKEIRFPADHGIAGATVTHQQIINVPDCYADPRFNTQVDKDNNYKTNTLLSVPLIGDNDQVVGVLQVLNRAGGPFTDRDEEVARALAVTAAVALSRALLVEDRALKEKMERDLEVASDIQQRILPAVLPQVDGYDIAGWSKPAEQTGGDVYDVVELRGGKVALLLGDATGHGIGPALSVSQMRSMFRVGLRLNAGLDAIVHEVNGQLTDDLPSDRFVTAFFGVLDPVEHTVAYQSAGQAPLLVARCGATGPCESLDATTLPLGILDPIELVDEGPIRFEPGDVLALISDGIYEYQCPGGEEYGSARLEKLLHDHRGKTSTELIGLIRDDVTAHARRVCEDADDAPAMVEQADDMTILLVRRVA